MLSTTNYAQNYAGIIGLGLIANIHRVFPITDPIISSLSRSLANTTMCLQEDCNAGKVKCM